MHKPGLVFFGHFAGSEMGGFLDLVRHGLFFFVSGVPYTRDWAKNTGKWASCFGKKYGCVRRDRRAVTSSQGAMPELPEVETVRRGLLPVMEGVGLTRTQVNRPDLRWPFPKNMAERLSGVTIERLGRRSKYILAELSSGETLIIHLGMSGRILISGDPLGQFHHDHPAPEKHDHVVFDLANGARVTFNDPRRFGAMDLVATEAIDSHKLIAALGPEPFGNDFHEDYLVSAMKSRRTPIKSALLDQKIVAGLGNIYVCEVL